MELTTAQETGTGDEAPVMDEQDGLSQERTIALILERSKRTNRTVPIRRSFLQQAASAASASGRKTPGPLRTLVSKKQERPLDIYLLLAAVTGAGDYSATDWSTTWARSVGLFDENTGGAAVSRAWKALKDLQLVSTSRGEGRKTKVTKLLEDGTGRPYKQPGDSPYFQLPFEYWEKGFNTKLSLPGKAMLLIALSLRKTEFSLVHARIQDWYGINPQTVAKGINELIEHHVLEQSGLEWFDTLHTRSGRGSRPLYQFQDPFVPIGLDTPAQETPSEQ
ncbi:hypothetical protein [Streptomyces sp. NPDC001717]|uniref:hypothetical protein n=1 Tax=Streptomyces sp. NPDC001717 TaxID=3364604 RepID=UPI0036BEFDA5